MAEERDASPIFRITYFGFGGRAAPLRLAAFLGDVSYIDKFESFSDHGRKKKNGLRRWCGMPELTIFDKNGKEVLTVGQSNACLRYIGTLTKLYPSDPVQRVLVDELLDSVEDMAHLMAPAIKQKDTVKQKSMRLALMGSDKLPYWLHKFENRLEENEKRGNLNGYFVGNALTVADLKFFCQISKILSGNLDYIDGDKLVAPNKRIAKFAQKVSQMEEVRLFYAQFTKQQKQYRENKVNAFIVKKK
eukprot:353723_1